MSNVDVQKADGPYKLVDRLSLTTKYCWPIYIVYAAVFC